MPDDPIELQHDLAGFLAPFATWPARSLHCELRRAMLRDVGVLVMSPSGVQQCAWHFFSSQNKVGRRHRRDINTEHIFCRLHKHGVSAKTSCDIPLGSFLIPFSANLGFPGEGPSKAPLHLVSSNVTSWRSFQASYICEADREVWCDADLISLQEPKLGSIDQVDSSRTLWLNSA